MSESELIDRMRGHWQRMWRDLNCTGDSESMFMGLVSLHTEAERFYHTFVHIEHGIRELQEAQHLFMNPLRAEWEWWHHDAIYKTRLRCNEELSAALSQLNAQAVNLPFDWGTKYIPLTKHRAIPRTEDEMAFVDIDLSIFGQPVDIFDEYERQIRQEYAWVPEKAFLEVRSNILSVFLRRRRNIYCTEHFQKKYGESADNNLQRSLANMTTRLREIAGQTSA